MKLDNKLERIPPLLSQKERKKPNPWTTATGLSFLAVILSSKYYLYEPYSNQSKSAT